MTSSPLATVRALVTMFVALAPAMAAAQEASTSIPLPATQYKLSRLAPGQTSGQAVFPVDAAGAVTVLIISNDGALTTGILGPAAQLISPATIDAFGGVYTTAAGGAADSPLMLAAPTTGFQYLYSFPSLGVGNYTVRFTTASAAEVAVVTQLTTDSRIGATLLTTDPTLVLGNPAVLTAAIFDGATPVTSANVAVTVVPAAGASITLTLHDDGAAGDDRAGDGLYSGEILPAATGTYLASAVMTGTTNGGAAFTRHGATSFAVVPKNGALAGTFVDNGVDDNGDGLFDRVSILVHAQAATEGTYRAFVHLSTATGQTLVRSGEADLLRSSPGITVDIDAQDLVQLQENGPYNVDLIELVFVDVNGAKPSDSVAAAGQTRPYQLSQFQRPLLALTGVNTEQAVDDNGNGKFDRLVVSLQVDVVRAGFYSWGFKLSDPLAREIDFGSGFGFFNAGLNQLMVTFDGTKIGAFGANGPYQLRDLLVQGPAASLVVTDIGRTQAYRVTVFEGARNNQAPVADAGVDRTVEADGSVTSVTLDASASSDPDGDSLTYEWRDSAGHLLATTATATVSLPLGASVLTLTVDDGRGGTATDDVTITVRDTIAPAISLLAASPNILWPPNHQMVPVSIAAIASDAVDAKPACAIASVASNEAVDGAGDGNTAPDWTPTGGLTLELRAERAGNGPGRVYTMTVRCRDASGNGSTGSVTVAVPHNR